MSERPVSTHLGRSAIIQRQTFIKARRGANAAKRFFGRLLKGLQYGPRVIVTDELRSYGVSRRQLLPGVEHRQSRYLVTAQVPGLALKSANRVFFTQSLRLGMPSRRGACSLNPLRSVNARGFGKPSCAWAEYQTRRTP
jgi:hypothetical protein